MKRICLAILAAVLLCLTGCGEKEATCIHSYEERVITPATYTQEGQKDMICSICGDLKKEAIPVKRTISILAIGNSFSVDAMEHLYGILDNAGFTDIYLGNLYIGGCSLDTHWDNLKKDNPAYIYYHNEYGGWMQTSGASVLSCLTRYPWDVITVQQASHDSGRLESYGSLQNILDALQENKTNPDARIYWHMTWAYQADSDHWAFPQYKNDQLHMYKGITTVTQMKVEKMQDISGILPAGTAIQNLRSSYLGDTLTRDGFHLSMDIGRYTAALTWYAALTGLDVENITYVPEQFRHTLAPHLPAIRAAVAGAVEKPYEVTDCSHLPKP